MVGAGREVMPERRKGGVYAAVNDILVDAAHDCDWIGYINDDDYWPADEQDVQVDREFRAPLAAVFSRRQVAVAGEGVDRDAVQVDAEVLAGRRRSGRSFKACSTPRTAR